MEEKKDLKKYLGTIFYGVVIESYLDNQNKKGQIRLRPSMNQGFPQNIHVSCSREKRKSFPIGTRFKMDLKVSQKSDGKFYLKSLKNSLLLTEEEYNSKSFSAKQLYFDFT